MASARRLPETVRFFLPFIHWWPTKEIIYYKEPEQLENFSSNGRIKRAEVHQKAIQEKGMFYFLMYWFFWNSFRSSVEIMACVAEWEAMPSLAKGLKPMPKITKFPRASLFR
jgi:hypothetical protein